MLTGISFPPPLTGAEKIDEATLETSVPNTAALKEWLLKYDLPMEEWGKGTTKTPDKLWKELKGHEAQLELYKKADGTVLPVRVTHVLRGKVCSQESREKEMFLLNTWQQYGDGRTRYRNGLLSEKLTIDELPLEVHLKEVCERAVTEEEMQRVVPSETVISETSPAPEYNPDDTCPLKVTDVHFVDHSIEIEESKSFPGLLTMYHLYTVDIVCDNLPIEDFNTLEYDGGSPVQKLKYIHAWVWMGWNNIRKYLFEGSECKDTVSKGRFQNTAEMENWFAQFSLVTDDWGTGTAKSVDNLWKEIENEEANLELYSKQDGCPIIVRVLHVLRGKVCSKASLEKGNFLFNTWQQFSDRRVRPRDHLLSKKVMTSEVPLTDDSLKKVGNRAVTEVMGVFGAPNFKLSDTCQAPSFNGESPVKVSEVDFEDHSYEIEESPSYPGLLTMYHFYTAKIVCDGLPDQGEEFSSFQYSNEDASRKLMNVFGWRWITWPQVIDTLHSRIRTAGRQQEVTEKQNDIQGKGLQALATVSEKVLGALDEVQNSDRDSFDQAASELRTLLAGIQELSRHTRTNRRKWQESDLPPDLVSSLAQKAQIDKSLTEGASKSVENVPQAAAPAARKSQNRRTSELPTLVEEESAEAPTAPAPEGKEELQAALKKLAEENAALKKQLAAASSSKQDQNAEASSVAIVPAGQTSTSNYPGRVAEITFSAGEGAPPVIRICLPENINTAKLVTVAEANGKAYQTSAQSPSPTQLDNMSHVGEPAAEESPCHSPWSEDPRASPGRPLPVRPQSAQGSSRPAPERTVADCWDRPATSGSQNQVSDYYTYPLRPNTAPRPATAYGWSSDSVRAPPPRSPRPTTPTGAMYTRNDDEARRRYPRYFRGEAERLRGELERSLERSYPRPPGRVAAPGGMSSPSNGKYSGTY